MADTALTYPLVAATRGMPQVGVVTVPLTFQPGPVAAGTVTIHTVVGTPDVAIEHQHDGCPGGREVDVIAAAGLPTPLNVGTLNGCDTCLPVQ
jgi:hypothetical protein